MKFDYEFSNLIGTVYHRGNVVFVDKSDVLIAPVGNKITAYDLKEHHSETFPIESQFNVVTVALDNAGANLLAVNEKGEGLFINLKSRSVLHRHRFNKQIKCIKFSPDGKRFAVCRDTDVQVFRSPGNLLGQFNPFFLEQVYHVANDQCISLDWSCDSKIFAVGAKDMQTRVCAAQRYQNMFMYSLAGHTSPITACFFEKDTFDLYTLDKRGFLVCWECQINSSQLIPQLTPGVPQSFSTLTGQSLRGEEETVNPKDNLLHYKLTSRHSFHDIVGNGVLLTCADYHKSNHLLVTGFSSGAFILHEMPEFNMIHNLR